MYRLLVGVLGVALALFPTRSLDVYERFALADPASTRRRSWVDPAVRGEGVVFAAAALAGGRSYTTLLGLVGVGAAAAALAPASYLALGGRVAYRAPGGVEWSDGFVRVVRYLGFLNVVVAASAVRRRLRHPRTDVQNE